MFPSFEKFRFCSFKETSLFLTSKRHCSSNYYFLFFLLTTFFFVVFLFVVFLFAIGLFFCLIDYNLLLNTFASNLAFLFVSTSVVTLLRAINALDADRFRLDEDQDLGLDKRDFFNRIN